MNEGGWRGDCDWGWGNANKCEQNECRRAMARLATAATATNVNECRREGQMWTRAREYEQRWRNTNNRKIVLAVYPCQTLVTDHKGARPHGFRPPFSFFSSTTTKAHPLSLSSYCCHQMAMKSLFATSQLTILNLPATYYQILSLVKCWFADKFLIVHCFTYIRDITWGIDVNSFELYIRYIGPHKDCENINFQKQ
jgi:hypothetical protein